MGKGKFKEQPKMTLPTMSGSPSPEKYLVRNLTENMIPVQIKDESGEIKNLHLRIQGRGGQRPPVIPASAITDHALGLQAKKMIRLEKIKG